MDSTASTETKAAESKEDLTSVDQVHIESEISTLPPAETTANASSETSTGDANSLSASTEIGDNEKGDEVVAINSNTVDMTVNDAAETEPATASDQSPVDTPTTTVADNSTESEPTTAPDQSSDVAPTTTLETEQETMHPAVSKDTDASMETPSVEATPTTNVEEPSPTDASQVTTDENTTPMPTEECENVPPAEVDAGLEMMMSNLDEEGGDIEMKPRQSSPSSSQANRKMSLGRQSICAGFIAPDCGAPAAPPHLSLRMAKALSAESRVKKVTDEIDDNGDVIYQAYPYNIDLGGFYPFPKTNVEMAKYGMGINFYFKILKGLGIAFAIMTAITLPSLIIFSQSMPLKDSQALYNEVVNSQTTLAVTTIASLHEPFSTCRSAQDGTLFGVACPDQFEISSFRALYGKPQGSCGCPWVQQTDSNNMCPGSVDQNYTIPAGGGGKLYSCQKDKDGNTLPCFQGKTRYGNDCCFYNSRDGIHPIIYDLSINPNPNCNSMTAPYIASALCKGKTRCEFYISPTKQYKVDQSKFPKDSPVNLICKSFDPVDGMCITDLMHNGIFTDCNHLEHYYSPTLRHYYKNATSSQIQMEAAMRALEASTNMFMFEGICTSTSVVLFDGQEYDPEYVVQVVQALDGIAIVVFIGALIWIQRAQNHEAEIIENDLCTAADYTVVCHSIGHLHNNGLLERCLKGPQHIADMNDVKQEVIKFFTETLSAIKEDGEEEEGSAEGGNKPKIAIADVNFSTSQVSYLSNACKRGSACKTVDLTVKRINSRIRRGVFKEDGKKEKSLFNQLRANLFWFEVANEECLRTHEGASTAFHEAYITFANEYSYLKCLRTFPSRPSFINWLVTPKEKKWNGNIVVCERAPEPNELIWENLAVPLWSQALRSLGTFIFTIALLGVSYAMIYQAMVLGARFQRSMTAIECSTYDVIVAPCTTSGSSCYTAIDAYYTAPVNVSSNTITIRQVLQDYNPTFYNVSIGSTTAPLGDAGSNMGFIKCYCEEVLMGYKGDKLKMDKYNFYDPSAQRYKAYCKDMVPSGGILATAANYIATFIIVLVNSNLKYMLYSFVEFEKHSTKTGRILSLTLKLFGAQYINTAMLSLIINGDLSRAGASDFIIGYSEWISFGIFTGSITDFDTKWYFTVGASLLFTMFMFTIGKSFGIFMAVVVEKMGRHLDRLNFWSCTCKKEHTHKELQSDLNELYMGPEMPIEDMYAIVLTVVFVDLTYSAGMPMMYIITAINLWLIYLFDKYLFLNHFRKPPLLNKTLPQTVIKTLFFAGVIHCCVGIWMFSYNGFSQNPQSYHTDTFISNQTSAAHPNTVFLTTITDLNPPVEWVQRIFGQDSIWNFIILCFYILWLSFSGIYQFLDYFGLGLILKWAWKCFKLTECLAKIGIIVPTRSLGDEAEGNPDYFDALPLATVQLRLSQDLLSPELTAIYRKRLDELLEEDAKALDKMVREYDEQEAIKATAATTAAANANADASAIAAAADIAGVVDPSIANKDDNKIKGTTSANASNCGTNCGAKCDPQGNDALCKPQPDGSCIPAGQQVPTDENARRWLVGHESYSMATSTEYAVKFGLTSTHLKRARPSDWIAANSDMGHDFKEDSETIAVIIENCMPQKDENGRIPWAAKVSMSILGFIPEFIQPKREWKPIPQFDTHA